MLTSCWRFKLFLNNGPTWDACQDEAAPLSSKVVIDDLFDPIIALPDVDHAADRGALRGKMSSSSQLQKLVRAKYLEPRHSG